MTNRNIVVLLGVIFVLVAVWNVLYFTGAVGNFGGSSTGIGVTPAPQQDVLGIPGAPERNGRPPAVANRGARQQDAPASRRGEIVAADISLDGAWGRNPFLTPREIWAIENYQVIPPAAINPVPAGGLQLSAVLGDSDGRRMAVINDNVVGVGDVVAGMEIIDVWADAVVFRLGTETHVLRMNDAAVRLTVRGDGAGGQ
jgi:hypothetical protein